MSASTQRLSTSAETGGVTTTSFASTWLLWQARWAAAAIVAFVPSIAVSVLVFWRADLARLSRTPMGRYVATFMSRKVEGIRLGGQAVMWAGAATHILWLVPSGFMIIVFAWMGGLLVPDRTPDIAAEPR